MPTIQAPAPPFRTTPNLPTRSAVKPRVLLADDYVPLLRALTRLLEDDCHLVGHATTVAELFELVDICQPDVVVLDISLPALPCTADETHGMTNLASRPRAGNISTDTRAG
jgi:CheY-like chemotaxis protein